MGIARRRCRNDSSDVGMRIWVGIGVDKWKYWRGCSDSQCYRGDESAKVESNRNDAKSQVDMGIVHSGDGPFCEGRSEASR